MNTRHKHYDVIVAWAEGKPIQIRGYRDREWQDFTGVSPSWLTEYEYRVKPEKREITVALVRHADGNVYVVSSANRALMDTETLIDTHIFEYED